MSETPGSLGRAAGSALRWNSVGVGVSMVSQFVQLLVLARLLAPREFGLAASALAVAGFAQGFTDLGLGNALVQHGEVDNPLWSNAWRACAGTGLILAAALFASAPAWAALLRLPGLAPVLGLAALALPFAGPASVYQAKAQRELRFARLATAEIVAALFSLAAALAWVAWRRDALAVVAGQITLTSVRCLALAPASRIAPLRGPWRWSDLRPVARFGGFQLGERALNAAAGNLDRLLVARWLGAAAAGYYTLGSQIALRPMVLLAPFAFRTLFPLWSRLQDDRRRIAVSFIHSVSLLCLLAAGVYALLGGLAPALVRVVLGPGWEPVSPVLRILAGLGWIWTASQPLASATLALGRARASFWLNVLVLATNAAGVLVGLHFGLTGAAWGILAAAAALLPLDVMLVRRWLQIPARQFLAAAARPLPAALAAGIAIANLIALPWWSAWPRFAALAVQGILAVAVYAAASRVFHRRGWPEAWVEMKTKIFRV